MSLRKIEESEKVISSYQENGITTIFVDGACKGNNKKGLHPGGWAFVVYSYNVQYKEKNGFKALTTNNEMEIKAFYEALSYIDDSDETEFAIFTDSMYIMNTLFSRDHIYGDRCFIGSCEHGNGKYNGWIVKWIREKFAKKKNVNMWKKVLKVSKHIVEKDKCVHFHHVNSHSGIDGNEAADMLACNAIYDNINY